MSRPHPHSGTRARHNHRLGIRRTSTSNSRLPRPSRCLMACRSRSAACPWTRPCGYPELRITAIIPTVWLCRLGRLRVMFWLLVGGCRWWAGRDKPKLVRLRIREAVGPRDPDDLEDAQASAARSDLNRSLYRSAATASSPKQKPRDVRGWSRRISSGTDASHSGQPSR
jgi:hypothetical protein